MKGRCTALFIESLLPAGLRIAACVLIAAAAAAVLRGRELFPFLTAPFLWAFALICISGAVFLIFYSFLRQMYFNSRLYRLLEGDTAPPVSFFSIKRLVRFLSYRLIVFAERLLWGIFYFTPAFSVLFIIHVSFAVNGCILKNTLYALSACAVLFGIIGGLFYFTSSGRYFFCDYLFSGNPLQPPVEIVSQSVSLARERLFGLLILRLRLFFRRIAVFNIAAYPFNRVYSECLARTAAEHYFCCGEIMSPEQKGVTVKRDGKSLA